MFQHNAVKLLYLCKQACPDTHTAVDFLTTRVKKPDEDRKKLYRFSRYLNNARNMLLTLKSDGTHIIKCWVDASYAIHNFMKSQNLGVMTLERFIHG